MFDRLLDLARPALLSLDAERAHEVALRGLELGAHPRQRRADSGILGQTLWGRAFPNPIGVAAGFDKDARVPGALLSMGMGFAEIGTVTPRPQDGNPRPRVFRIPEAQAVINRLGFNNGGHATALSRLAAHAGRFDGRIVGVNIGANKDSKDRAGDYVSGITAFAKVASYFTVNVSSPNTPGLRDLQAPAELRALLTRVIEARDETARDVPVIVKLAPDVSLDDLPEIVACILDCRGDGICVSNTTLRRTDVVRFDVAQEAGGLSGAPLFELSTIMLARVHALVAGAVPLIGVGGIHSGATAVSKIEAGASLIQLYTGMIYSGAPLITEMKSAIVDACRKAGVSSVSGLVGSKAEEWARRPLPE